MERQSADLLPASRPGYRHETPTGVLKEGDPLPSVRTVAADYRVNPLTVLKAYQQLVDEELVEMKRGRGMFINVGARTLLFGANGKFLDENGPGFMQPFSGLA